MNQENYVMFKGTKNGINILLQQDIPFSELKVLFEKKVIESAKFFEGVKTSIAFQGRTLSQEEETSLLDIITEHTTMNITFIRDGKKEDNTQTIPEGVTLPDDMEQYYITKYHKGSIRSGQCLTFDGSVVVIGDVNPGGEIKASGNIIILGQLKGIAHAGCNGMTDAFVSALYMIPVQLRIADIITRFPEENKKGPKPPEFAYIEEGQIYVMPLA
ncbi:MAG: septum site-determining protein MinC [Firmicutes bacterium]|nr:septum site-determining protein MinC [Bacillota bacterium]